MPYGANVAPATGACCGIHITGSPTFSTLAMDPTLFFNIVSLAERILLPVECQRTTTDHKRLIGRKYRTSNDDVMITCLFCGRLPLVLGSVAQCCIPTDD